MKRRNFIATVLGAIAAVPFLGWLRFKEISVVANNNDVVTMPEYTDQIAKVLEAESESPTKLTVEKLYEIQRYAEKYKISPFITDGKRYYVFNYKNDCYEMFNGCLTPRPNKSIL